MIRRELLRLLPPQYQNLDKAKMAVSYWILVRGIKTKKNYWN